MLARLFLLFTLVPLAELYVLIRVGRLLGLWPTIGVVVLTGLVGALLAKAQGYFLLRRLAGELEQGQMPADSLLHGLVIFVGGLLLVTPGFLTDLFGLIALLPPTRLYFVNSLKRSFAQQMASGRVVVFRASGVSGASGRGRDDIIDVTPEKPIQGSEDEHR